VSSQLPVFGTFRVPSPLNSPGARRYGSMAAVGSGSSLRLFHFGGYGANSDLVYSDLWEINPSTGSFAWYDPCGLVVCCAPLSVASTGLLAATMRTR
jgi:hypothetical protein